MGYLQDKLKEAQNVLKHYEYEISEEVTNRKLEWQKQIAERLENDEFEGVLDIEDEYIKIRVESYEPCVDETFTNKVHLIKVVSDNGEVYAEDDDGEEYFIDDIDEQTFEAIYDVVINLTE